MDGTIILPCKCEHEDQDKIYGKGMRVHNISGKKGSELAYCAVCTPRRGPADKMPATPRNPALGMLMDVPAQKPRVGKTIPRKN